MKRCPTCDEFKAESEFNRDATRVDGLDWRCKFCKSAGETALGRKRRDAKRYAKDSRKVKARSKAHANWGEARLYKCSVLGCERYADSLHHPDYDEPLEVVPLCKMHHLKVHNE